MDFMGPLTKSATGFKYILIILDYAIQFLEAIPLWNITASTIAGGLLKIFPQVGLSVKY